MPVERRSAGILFRAGGLCGESGAGVVGEEQFLMRLLVYKLRLLIGLAAVAVAGCGKTNTDEGQAKSGAGTAKQQGVTSFNGQISAETAESRVATDRGEALTRQGEFDQAIAQYNEALRLDPTNMMAYNGRGWTWNEMRQYDKGVVDLNEALRSSRTTR